MSDRRNYNTRWGKDKKKPTNLTHNFNMRDVDRRGEGDGDDVIVSFTGRHRCWLWFLVVMVIWLLSYNHSLIYSFWFSYEATIFYCPYKQGGRYQIEDLNGPQFGSNPQFGIVPPDKGGRRGASQGYGEPVPFGWLLCTGSGIPNLCFGQIIRFTYHLSKH